MPTEMTLAEGLSVASWHLLDDRATAHLLWSSQVREAPAPRQGPILLGNKNISYTLTKTMHTWALHGASGDHRQGARSLRVRSHQFVGEAPQNQVEPKL